MIGSITLANFSYLGNERSLLFFYDLRQSSPIWLLLQYYLQRQKQGHRCQAKKEPAKTGLFYYAERKKNINSGTEISQAEIVDLLFQNRAENTQK